MKRKHILTIALCLSALSAMPAYAAGWVQENGEWYYEDNYGDYVTDTWRSSGNGEYYLGDDGRMVTSALIDTGSALYYVDSSGRRVENSWRQLMDDDGELAWYYFQSSGKAKEEGYLTIEGTRYHFTDYKLDTGWTEGDDGDYYFDADTYQPGWHYVEEFGDYDLEPGWYYTKSNGEVVKGEERKINGYYYAFNDNGLMCDGWVEFTEDGETICKYYRLGNGDRMDGWIWHDGTDSYDASIEHEEGWYYLRNGRPYTSEYRTTKISDDYGVAKINNKYYCFDENGLIPAIVQDHYTKEVLTLAYMNAESLAITIDEGRTCFWSRSRQELWRKGETSGNVQHVVSITADCDADALVVEVVKDGPACHTGAESCFFQPVYLSEELKQFSYEGLYRLIEGRKTNPKEGSYTTYLFEKGLDKILKKVGEECTEVIIGGCKQDRDETIYEIADLTYHVMVLMVQMGITVEDVTRELEKRHVIDHKVKQERMQ